MKKINGIFYFFLMLLSINFTACEDESLELKNTQTGDPTKVGLAGGGNLIIIGADTTLYTKDNEKIVVPLQINLEKPAAKAFRVALKVDKIKLAAELAANAALKDVKALGDRFYSVPQDVMIPMGSKVANFDLTINISALEFDYTSQQAVAVSILDPTKGNTVDAGKSYVIAVYKPAEIFSANAIRKVSFDIGGTTEFIPKNKDRNNFTQTNIEELTIPVKLLLTGAATQFVNIDIIRDKQFEQQAIQTNPALAGAVPLDSTEYFMPLHPQLGNFKTNLTLDLKVTTFKFEESYFKKKVLAFTISNVSRHQVDQTKKTILFVFDPAYLMDLDVTDRIKNNQLVFGNSARQQGGDQRWGILADWTVNAAVKQRPEGMGSWSNDEVDGKRGVFHVEVWGGEPLITNGKIYQTIPDLPPGKYKLVSVEREHRISGKAYLVASASNTLPDVDQVETSSLGWAKLSNDGSLGNPEQTGQWGTGDQSYEVNFTLTQQSNVTIGIVGNWVEREHLKIRRFTLKRSRDEFQ